MDIADWRKQIDEIDAEIVALISKRAEAAKAIGQIKQNEQLPIYEPKREQNVFEHVKSINPGPLDDAELILIFERLMDVMRSVQRSHS